MPSFKKSLIVEQFQGNYLNLNNCFELSNDEIDLVILASIQAFTHRESSGTKRERSPRCSFYYQSVPICKEMFLHFYGLSDARFRPLKEHYQNHGVSLRTHGNTKRLPHNTLSQASVEEVKAFLSNYVEENAICLPGRIPGFKCDEIKVLSSSETKKTVRRAYEGACEASDLQTVCYTKFLELWGQFYPNVVVAKPMTDLSLTCQQNTTKLQRAANLSDSENFDTSSMNHRLATHFATIMEFGIPIQNLLVTIRLFPLLASY